MTDREVKLVLGALLHDIGKVIYRQGDDRRKHSQSGYDFLRDEVCTEQYDTDILNCVRYHHADAIKGANIENNALAYIVYIADNIASAADRRQNDSEDAGFETAMPLQSVFNILNQNNEDKCYEPKTLNPEEGINYPTSEKRKFDESFYTKIKANLMDNLSGLMWTQEYINSLLEVLEANLSYVPSSTAKHEMADISLYDHMKLTAAVSSCILEYLDEQQETDYKDRLYIKGKDFYAENAFLLYSMDISGIQDFIYTITSQNAFKTLRVRSFYLEIMMEHMIDCLLQELHLSRANLIYCGGGHCYLLIANTVKSKEVVEQYMKQLNKWLLDTFQIFLYVAWGYAQCSADTLKNYPQGSYEQLFKEVSESLSKRKSSRYSVQDIKMLNAGRHEDYSRECKVCKRISKVSEDGLCTICSAIEGFSKNILKDSFFTVTLNKSETALPLPGGYYLISDNEDSLKAKMEQDNDFVRAYSKNAMYTGRHIATKLWVGDYAAKNARGTISTLGEYADASEGIERIGVLRADVDNLGQAFVSGFANPKNQNRYVTLSRTATLSRQLSLFFKCHINKMLAEGSYAINGNVKHKRNAAICYSGGDDLFIVGAWNEIIEIAIDLRRNFERYTQGTLTLSAGIGIYAPGYPISAIADEVADMEESSKALPGKNAVTIFPDGSRHGIVNETGKEKVISDGTYSWQEFEQEVLGEKYRHIYEFFETSEDRGKNFLYHLLELIRLRSEEDKIHFARYVYLLSRLEPDKNAPPEQKAAYKEFSLKMYQWYQGANAEADCRHLKTAMNLYAYLKRDKEESADADK
ncbi:MAG: type III-A CRISPR-associated protein Cas10/Csm1 [Bacteroidales bacterium]|nr:type III-A CRISPR-associated protein Cas10/Csm1 [Lachnoclostridium sp.]MCM1383156.1 type III-A CRISPR-associated protein Cas10/Csm1 [Lachnoclostridium sp.]MCM1464618.1 type III-A CRISPR-associated protein Cas10/Csm1 [Bacteroidales bacterium]